MNCKSMGFSAYLVTVFVVMLGSAMVFAGEETTRDGVLHVDNGSKPAQGVEVRQLEEHWRVGGEDSEDFFGLISQVIVDEQNNIYLLDTRLSEVPVYSTDGERIATLSREGEGPGETRIPSDLLLLPDGNLGLIQVFPGKITKIDLQGDPQGTFEANPGDAAQGGFVQFFDCQVQGDALVISGINIHQQEAGRRQAYFVAAYDMQGQELVRYIDSEVIQNFQNFEFDEDAYYQVDFRKFAVGTDGRVYTLPFRNDYAVKVFNTDGTVDRIFGRDFEPVKRTDEEYTELKERTEGQILTQLPNAKITISHTHEVFTGIRLGVDGNIWLQTSRGHLDQPEGVLFTWDVFDPDGHFLKQVSARTEGDGQDDLIRWLPNGRAIQVTGFVSGVEAFQNQRGGAAVDEDDEAAPMEVIYYSFSE